MHIRELRTKRANLNTKARSILDRADSESRGLTTAEQSEFDRLITECEALGKRIEAEERMEEYAAIDARSAAENAREVDARRPPGHGFDDDESRNRERAVPRGTFVFEDAQGRNVRSLMPHESFAAAFGDRPKLPDGIKTEELSLGRMVRGHITGDWSRAQAEQRAMSVGTGSEGGFMVPEPLSAIVIDLARNSSKVMAAGAQTVPMTSSTLALARWTGAPTAGFRAENVLIPASDASLDRLTLESKTLAARIPVSMELLEDANNIGSELDRLLRDSLSLQLDASILFGAGSGDLVGIRNTVGIQTIDMGTNGGPIDLDVFSNAVELVQSVNGPDAGLATIYSSRTSGEIDRLKDLEGRYLASQGPLSWQNLKKLVSNQIPEDLDKGTAENATDAYVGSWREVIVGMRNSIRVVVARESHDQVTGLGFSTGTVHVMAYLRADMVVARPNQMVLIDGIVPPAP